MVELQSPSWVGQHVAIGTTASAAPPPGPRTHLLVVEQRVELARHHHEHVDLREVGLAGAGQVVVLEALAVVGGWWLVVGGVNVGVGVGVGAEGAGAGVVSLVLGALALV